jgi:signal transduction histidine kinase
VTETPKLGATAWLGVERRKSAWAVDWQSTVERDKETLARTLHDNTGGLLVAAVMDITWAENNLQFDASQAKERLRRARAALDVAIDLNRRMIEDLRPTLLDNLGLIAALKWHFSEACKTANVVCEQYFPESSPTFSPPAAIALYRIAQTLTAAMVSHQPHSVIMELAVAREFVTLTMSCDGMPNAFSRDDDTVTDALASVTGRIQALGGNMQFDSSQRGAVINCRLPSDKALRTASP